MVELGRSGTLDEGGLADWKGVVGSEWWVESAKSVTEESRTVHTLVQGSIAT
jgi:hypothetical protein